MELFEEDLNIDSLCLLLKKNLQLSLRDFFFKFNSHIFEGH